MIRLRSVALWALVVVCAVAGRAPDASAAAEVHKLNLMLSASPSSLNAKDFNDDLDTYNRLVITPRGYDELKALSFGWYFQGEARYFIRPNIAISAGYGTLSAETKREYLPRISQAINIDAHLSTAVANFGASYYLAPFNQGDFQARAYLSGGLLSMIGSEFKFTKTETNTDSTTTLGGFETIYGANTQIVGKQDGPGWYAEVGAHMFFASRFSVMLGVLYRDMKVSGVPRQLTETDRRNGLTISEPFSGGPTSVDLSGMSARMAVCIGF